MHIQPQSGDRRSFPQLQDEIPDQVIDAGMARSIQANAAEAYVLLGWIVTRDQPDHPGKFIARLATTHPTIYIMVADTLEGLQAMLPRGLVRSDRQYVDPPDVVEIWFST